MVACQPAIGLRLQPLMTIDAELHLKIYRLQPVHSGHVPMADDAIEFGHLNMRLVTEFDIIRHKENTDPRNRYFLIIMFLFLNQLGMERDNIIVAEKTFLQRRKPGFLRTVDERMAEAAVDLLDPGMNPVAERNRLFRTNPQRQVKVI